MFKDIRNRFEKKKLLLGKNQSKDQQIKREVTEFLKAEFGKNLKGLSFGVDYNGRDNSLTIRSDSKVIASELSMKLAALAVFLKERGVGLSRILVR